MISNSVYSHPTSKLTPYSWDLADIRKFLNLSPVLNSVNICKSETGEFSNLPSELILSHRFYHVTLERQNIIANHSFLLPFLATLFSCLVIQPKFSTPAPTATLLPNLLHQNFWKFFLYMHKSFIYTQLYHWTFHSFNGLNLTLRNNLLE